MKTHYYAFPDPQILWGGRKKESGAIKMAGRKRNMPSPSPSRIRSLPLSPSLSLSVWENGVWGIGVIDTLHCCTAIQTAYRPPHACLIERAETQKSVAILELWQSVDICYYRARLPPF